ncbi:MAG: TRAP transporter small permease [Betaproteobacteria bacterium]
MKFLFDLYHRLLVWLLVGTVAILIVPVTLQILSRFTDFVPAYIWTEELARFMFIWMVMIGAMIGVREGTHFEVDVWPVLGARANALLRIVSHLLVLVFALVFVWWGIAFIRFGWDQLSEIAELPMWTIFIAWPIAGITWTLFIGESFVASARALLKGAPR